MRYQLIHRGKAIPLKGTALIGRSVGCDVVLEGPNISRRHARILVTDDVASVEDLGSSNGVFVNGTRIEGPHELHDGDELHVGAHLLQFVGKAAAEKERRSSGDAFGRKSQIDSLWDDEEELEDGDSTGSGYGLDLVGAAVDGLLAEGDVARADKTLSPLLKQILHAAQSSAHVDSQTVASATSYALKLAAAGSPANWLSYPVELHTATETLLSADAVDTLAEHLGPEDSETKKAVDRYLAAMAARSATLSSSQRDSLRRLEQLLA
jgi:hypothetical protein